MSDADKATKKKKRDIVIASVLVVTFLVLLAHTLLTTKRPPRPPAPAATPAAAPGTSMTDHVVFITGLRSHDKLRQDQEQAWQKEWDRDPFVAQASASAIVRAVNLTLKGVLWDETAPKAIVNEKTLIIGDTIYGYTVVEIKPRSVILKTGEKNIELFVFRPFITES